MTHEEVVKEWNYQVDERLGMLAGSADPTPAQWDEAMKTADREIEKVKAQANENQD